ncbi:glycine betaine ABC transporter substrate-binding protein [soil metagenome]|jgi:osmoprotectant transport system substrate-binding protein
MRRFLCTAATALLLVAAGCAEEPVAAEPSITLGVGSTDEQRMLAALTIAALDRAGIAVTRTELGDTVRLRREAQRGTVDLYWDYTGAAWALGLNQQGPHADPTESFEQVREEDVRRGLVWLDPTRANATLALFVRAADLPAEPGQRTMTWLAGELSRGGKRLCLDPDFRRRPAGYVALAEVYSIQRASVPLEEADESKAVAKVADGTCFAGLATATSGEAVRAGLAPVADDQRVFPAFIVAPVVREETHERLPQIAEILDRLVDGLGTDDLARLNAQLTGDADPTALAEAFLAEVEGLPPPPSA